MDHNAMYNAATEQAQGCSDVYCPDLKEGKVPHPPIDGGALAPCFRQDFHFTRFQLFAFLIH